MGDDAEGNEKRDMGGASAPTLRPHHSRPYNDYKTWCEVRR